MRLVNIVTAIALLIVLGVPFALRGASPGKSDVQHDNLLIIVTPHVQQIMDEYSVAFDQWHRREYGEPVTVSYRRPGGTSEILKQLQAQYAAAVKAGHFVLRDGQVVMEPGTMPFDLMFGGGSYDHGRLKDGITLSTDAIAFKEPISTGDTLRVPLSEPAGYSQEKLDDWFGPNKIGAQKLYDDEQYWIGTALSAFGIVYNRDLFREIDRPEPSSFDDLTDPKLFGMVALADPRQSGSITTTFDSILNAYGWDDGWRILRLMSANTRYFTASSTKPPIDVSSGDAAAGLAIDFYGRTQAQVVMRPGETVETSRVGYAEPKGAVYIDADPASVLRGGPRPDLARRFIEFVLSEEGQAIWDFHAIDSSKGADNPIGPDGEKMGPAHHVLRRMPVRRVMYEKYGPYLVDDVNPFEVASDVESRGWRSSIGIMMGAFGIETSDELKDAWEAVIRARETDGFPPDVLKQMEDLLLAMPDHEMPDGSMLVFSEENYRPIRGSWRESPRYQSLCAIRYAEFFRNNYDQVVRLEREHRPR